MALKELNFRTFDELLTSVLLDLRILEEEGLVEPATLIKVAQRINYDLGLRINQTKEIILDVTNHVAKLPDDFEVLNFALLTGKHRTITPIEWAGRTTEQVSTSCSGETCCLTPLTYDTNRLNPNMNYLADSCLTGNPPNTCTPEWDPWFQRKCFSVCGSNNCVKVIEKRGSEVREYEWFEKLDIIQQSYKDPGTMNPRQTTCHTGQIKNGFLYVHTNRNCHVYLSYQGALEDENGNLLVLDHPEVNFYYETALKEHIFKNLWYSSGEEVKGKLDELKMELRENRVRALSIVNTPDFKQMQDVFRDNRAAQWKRYYRFFETGVFNSWFRTLPF